MGRVLNKKSAAAIVTGMAPTMVARLARVSIMINCDKSSEVRRSGTHNGWCVGVGAAWCECAVSPAMSDAKI